MIELETGQLKRLSFEGSFFGFGMLRIVNKSIYLDINILQRVKIENFIINAYQTRKKSYVKKLLKRF